MHTSCYPAPPPQETPAPWIQRKLNLDYPTDTSTTMGFVAATEQGIDDCGHIPCESHSNTHRSCILGAQRALFAASGVPTDSKQSSSGATTLNYEERCIERVPGACSMNAVIVSRNDHTADSESPRDVLVMLHGWGIGLGAYSMAAAHLAHSFTLYILDLPGMGASDRCPFPECGSDSASKSLSFFLHHLEDCYQALLESDPVFRNAPHRHIVGHSMGGYIAAHWQLHSRHFDTLVLASPVGVPKRPPPRPKDESSDEDSVSYSARAIRAAVTPLWERGVTPQAFLRRLPPRAARKFLRRHHVRGKATLGIRIGGPGSYEEYENEDLLDALIEYEYRVTKAPPGSERAYATLLEPGAWAHMPLIDRVAELDCPTAFCYGEHDWMDADAGRDAQKHISTSTAFRMIPSADHNLHMTNPHDFAQFVKTFCMHAKCDTSS